MEDERRQQQEQARAGSHDLRRTILQFLEEGAERTLSELTATIPDAAAAVIPPSTPKETVITYHLRVLHHAKLVGCADGVYRALA
jgi:hypothetical protein